MNRKTYAFALLAVAAALTLAACGGSSSSGGGYGGEESSSSSSNNETASNSGGGYSGKGGGAYAGGSESSSTMEAGGEAAQVSVGTAKDVGQVLVNAEGLTLYYFEKDKKGSGVSKCSGPCAEGWPPLLTEGEPKGMSGVQASMLGTIEREDGTTQVTYAGWPLYTFVEDKAPGEDNGTDSKAFGASWYPLHANGEKAGH